MIRRQPHLSRHRHTHIAGAADLVLGDVLVEWAIGSDDVAAEGSLQHRIVPLLARSAAEKKTTERGSKECLNG
jgi:hypothetical protein